MTDVASIRREYRGSPLERDQLHEDPIAQLQRWLEEALHAEIIDPTAMTLATVCAGRPSARTVLLKTFDGDGLVFYTNLESRKARDIADNDHVALLFHWPPLSRQIAIEGKASRVSHAQALAYFATRPRGSQIGAWISPQSSVISTRSLLLTKYEEMKQKLADREVPFPSMWGGYRVKPDRFEFWQGRPNRLHDRFQYLPVGAKTWGIDRLAP